MKQTSRGVTIVEMMVGAVILLMTLSAIFKLTSSGQRSAVQVMQGHQVNEEIRRAIDLFSDDVREANIILDPSPPPHIPPHLTPNPGNQPIDEALTGALQAGTLKTSDPNNRVRLIKCRVLPPNKVSGGTAAGMIEKSLVEYFFQGIGDTRALIRKTVNLDANNNEIPASAFIKPIINDIFLFTDHALFFRVGGNQSLIGARNIFFALDITRKERTPDGAFRTGQLFHAKVLTSVHIRGSAPEKL
jgi:hypothetical protein